MKNLLLIITTLLLVTAIACTKTKQRIFHNKDWKNIQGTWDIEQVLIDGKDSTSEIKDSCYHKSIVQYQGEDRDGTLHLYSQYGRDHGSLNVEQSKYKTLLISSFNLNIYDGSVDLFSFCHNPLAHKQLLWNIDLLNEQALHISVIVNNKLYQVKYQKP